MSRFLGVVLVGVVSFSVRSSLARAQPAPDEPPPPTEPPQPAPQAAPPPTQPVPPPQPAPAQQPAPAEAPPAAPLHEQCVERRHEIQSRAEQTQDLDERTRLLKSLPDCSKADPVLPPAPPTCGEGQTLVEGACVSSETGIRGTTTEFSLGLAWLNAGGSSNEIVHGVGGINVGIGQFVTRNVAMSLRLSGITSLDKGELYLGVIGPNVQVWAGKAFVGGGIGLGFIIGCPENGSCDGSSTSGFNLRTGFLAGDHATISFEMNSMGGLFTAGSIQTAAILLGVQSF